MYYCFIYSFFVSILLFPFKKLFYFQNTFFLRILFINTFIHSFIHPFKTLPNGVLDSLCDTHICLVFFFLPIQYQIKNHSYSDKLVVWCAGQFLWGEANFLFKNTPYYNIVRQEKGDNGNNIHIIAKCCTMMQ